MLRRLLIISLNGDPLGKYGTEHAGGQVKYILELGKYLVREGWEIDVYTIRNNGLPVYQSITEGFNIIRFSLPGDKNYSYQVTGDDINYLQKDIEDFVADKNPIYSVILGCYWLSGLIGLKISKLIQKKLLMSFCSLGYYKQQGLGMSGDLEMRIRTETEIAEACDHIIATTYEERNILKEQYHIPAEKITVIPRGVDLNVFYKY